MSDDNKDKDNPKPNEEEKVPDSLPKKSNKEPQYPSLPVQIRKDGQEVVPWTMNPTSDFVNPYGLTLKRKKRIRTYLKKKKKKEKF